MPNQHITISGKRHSLPEDAAEFFLFRSRQTIKRIAEGRQLEESEVSYESEENMAQSR